MDIDYVVKYMVETEHRLTALETERYQLEDKVRDLEDKFRARNVSIEGNTTRIGHLEQQEINRGKTTGN